MLHPSAMLYQRFCMFLIKFRNFDTFEIFAINRSVHKRALEGDGEKPSRQEHEGPPPYTILAKTKKTIMMDVSQRPGSQKSQKYTASRTFWIC